VSETAIRYTQELLITIPLPITVQDKEWVCLQKHHLFELRN
jgi:hypothetical protein